jgi:hypothetical protein
MTNDIPWDKLGISDSLRARVAPEAARAARLGAARGDLVAPTEEKLSALYVLACDADDEIRESAIGTLRELPGVADALTQRTHSKVLEILASTRTDPAIDARIMQLRNTNDRTAALVASRADVALATAIAEDHERLLISPDVLVALHANPACPDAPLERAISFMRMQRALPELPEKRPAPGEAPPPAKPPAAPAFDLEAEIEAALAGKASPMLEQRRKLEMFNLDALTASGPVPGFTFDFKDANEFSLDMLEEGDGETDELRGKLEKKIAEMSIGQKLKLAYLGNKSVRNILIRDRNKMVSVAVVKSGRLTDAEVLAHAGNRNLPDDAVREIAMNKEWIRKYPVKVALVNNPKCPPSVAVGLINHLQAKDLESLARNRNVPNVVFTLAGKTAKAKKQH